MSTSNGSSKTPTASSAAGSGHGSLSGQALFYMLLLSLQFGMQPILTRKFTPPSVCRSSVIIVQEMLKFVMAFVMLGLSGNFKKAVEGWSISTWLSVAAVPAGLYSIQNMAALLAYQNLDGVTFNVLNQTKTLSAALCCYLLMGRKQSKVQIFALFLLLAAALVIEKIIPLEFGVQSNNSKTGEGSLVEISSKHLTHGVLPVLLASFLSGLAGAISQKNLQSSSGCGKSGGRNPYLFSMELCIASCVILSVSLLFREDGARIQNNGFFDQWTVGTMIPIITNSVGGIIVGLVTKYAGSVRKGFALIFGILLSGLIQAWMVDNGGERVDAGGFGAVSKEQVVGGMFAAISLWMHATNPNILPSVQTAKTVDSSQKTAVPVPSRRPRKARKED